MPAIHHIRDTKPDTSNTLMRLISRYKVLTMPPRLPPEGLAALLIEEELSPPTTSREGPIKLSHNITRAMLVAEALIPNINKMIIMGRQRQTTMGHMVKKKSSNTTEKLRLLPITLKAASTQAPTRQEQAATKPPLGTQQPTLSLRTTMVAIVGNIKIARATLSMLRMLIQAQTKNGAAKPNTLLAAGTIRGATGKLAHQGVPVMIRAELHINARMAIKNLVPTTQAEGTGIGTEAQTEHQTRRSPMPTINHHTLRMISSITMSRSTSTITSNIIPKTPHPSLKMNSMRIRIHPLMRMATQWMMIKYTDIVARRTAMTNIRSMPPKIPTKSKRSYPHR